MTDARQPREPEDIAKAPVDDIFVDFLMSKRRESAELDFKRTIDISRNHFPEVAKHIFAMANYGGGYLLLGFDETETGGFDAVGLPPDFHIDQADLQQKFNAYASDPIALGYREFDRQLDGLVRKFAVVYVPPSTTVLYPKSEGFAVSPDDKQKRVFQRSDVLIRRGTQSVIATDAERESIKRRAEQTDYEISLISGRPDRVDETLYSNLFKVRRIPSLIFAARLAVQEIPFSAQLATPFVDQDPWLYSFEDPFGGPLAALVRGGTIQKHDVESMMKDKDRRNVVLWLLDKSLVWEARQRGMWAWRRKVYYPLREGESDRREGWPGLARESSRLVATMMYAQQLREKVGVHPAADVHFTTLDEKLYVRLLPTFILTENGRRVRRGEGEGTVITRLTHDEYNKQFLRNVLFWAAKLGAGAAGWKLLDGLVEIEPEPMQSQIDVGIRGDRPTVDSLRRDTGPTEGDD